MTSQSILRTVIEDGGWASLHRTLCSGRNTSASDVWGAQIFLYFTHWLPEQSREKEKEKGHNSDELSTHKKI